MQTIHLFLMFTSFVFALSIGVLLGLRYAVEVASNGDCGAVVNYLIRKRFQAGLVVIVSSIPVMGILAYVMVFT
jgi:hypothetical protein